MRRTLDKAAFDDPGRRELEYWRTVVRNALLASTLTAGLGRNAVELLVFFIARAVHRDLTDPPSTPPMRPDPDR